MKNVPLEIVIPIFNEGEKIINLVKKINNELKIEYRILFCYDDEKDDIFSYKSELLSLGIDINFIKNPVRDLCQQLKKESTREIQIV